MKQILELKSTIVQKAVIGKLKNTELKNVIPELKNSFSWVQESLTDRIPRQLQKHGFDENDENLHVYMIVALHPLQNLRKEFGIIDIPRDQVLKSTYAAIDRGVNNINHKYKTNTKYKNVILDAEYESERQEYVVASNDPDIHSLIQNGYITAVSIQGTPRVYLEQCSNCIGDLCQCKLIPKGLVLGVADGDALAWVMTRDGQYNGQNITGEPPADPNTSIEIMMTDSKVHTLTLTQLSQIPRHKLHEISNNSFKDSSKNLHMVDTPPSSGTTATEHDEEEKKKMEEMQSTITKLTADLEQLKNSMTEVQNSSKEMKATVDSLKETSTKLTDIQNSIRSLVATDEEAKRKFDAFEKDKKQLLEQINNGQPGAVKLTEAEQEIVRKTAIQNTPLKDFIK